MTLEISKRLFLFGWIFIQYLFDGNEHSVEPLVHGNCKKKHSSPYVRIKESTVNKLKSKSFCHTPKNAYHDVQESQGGVAKASSISDLPTILVKSVGTLEHLKTLT